VVEWPHRHYWCLTSKHASNYRAEAASGTLGGALHDLFTPGNTGTGDVLASQIFRNSQPDRQTDKQTKNNSSA
jgi:hypothetical protein